MYRASMSRSRAAGERAYSEVSAPRLGQLGGRETRDKTEIWWQVEREKRERSWWEMRCKKSHKWNEQRTDFSFGRKGGDIMGDGSRRAFLFFFMDHKHREETPILRECQEFSRELLAFATAAAQHARVRGSVTFLLSCGACSIAPIRARDLLRQFITARGRWWRRRRTAMQRFSWEDEARTRTPGTAQRDERDARAYWYYADRPATETIAEVSRQRRRLTYRLPPSRGHVPTGGIF